MKISNINRGTERVKQITKNFKGHYKEIILGPFFKMLEAIFELLIPLVMANIIDIGIKNGNKEYIIQKGLLMLLFAVLGAAAAITCQYFAATAAGEFGRDLRNQLYRHVMRLSDADVEKFGTSGLITRLSNDTSQIQNGLNMAIRLGSRVPFLAIGSIIMAMILDWRIGIVFLIATFIIVIILYFVMRETIPRYVEIQQGQDDISRLSQENLDGVRVIRAFSKQDQEKQDFSKAGDRLANVIIRVGRISATLNPVTTAIANFAVIAIVWLGAQFAFKSVGEPGEIIALVGYMNQMLLALVLAANLIVLFTKALASARRVEAVLEIEPSVEDGKGAVEDIKAPVVSFENVDFAYEGGGELALENINFSLAKGKTLGIIGGTGCGKSTLANLIVRNYDTQSGSVKIEGANVKDYGLNDLRAKIGFVPQSAALFSGTIRYNLQLGAPNASDEELWQALKIAQSADFVEKLSDGLDYVIEEGAKNVSGGQKQRLTIARALTCKPEILILDDSASALDYATDAALRHALRHDTENLTTIIISQRAVSIKNADSILVLDDGKIVGEGTHDELLKSNEIYKEICISQGLVKPEEVPA